MPMRQPVTDKVIQRDQHIVPRAEVGRTAVHQPDQFIDAHLRWMEIEKHSKKCRRVDHHLKHGQQPLQHASSLSNSLAMHLSMQHSLLAHVLA